MEQIITKENYHSIILIIMEKKLYFFHDEKDLKIYRAIITVHISNKESESLKISQLLAENSDF